MRLLNALKAEPPVLLVVGRLGATGLAFVTSPIIARAIGPTGRGETAAALAAFAIVPILLAFGVPMELRRLAALGKPTEALRAGRIVCLLTLPLAVILGGVGFLTVFAALDQEARTVASAGVAFSPLAMWWMCDLAVLVATGRLRGVMFMQLAQPIVYLAAILSLWAIGQVTTATVLLASIAGTLATSVLGMALTRVSLKGRRHPVGRLLRGSARFAGSAIAEAASNRLDQLVALPLMGALQAGLYSAAVTVASLPFALAQALGAYYFPRIAQIQTNRRRALKEEAVRASIAIATMSVVIMIPTILVGIPVLFGNEFVQAIPVALVCLLGTAATTVSYVCSMALAAVGQGRRMTVGQAVSLMVGLALLVMFAPRWGAMGAAAASMSSAAALLTLLLVSMEVRLSRSVPRLQDFRHAVRKLVRSGGHSGPSESG